MRKYKYKKSVWNFMGSKEIEINGLYDYGAKGQTREKKIEVTQEQVEINNQKNREKRMRRLLKANFGAGDWWDTLKYPAGTRKNIDEIEKDLEKFRRNTRNAYKKRGYPFQICIQIRSGRTWRNTYPHGNQSNSG